MVPHGEDFVFAARLNTMAENIDGVTIHSFFKIPFQSNLTITKNSIQQKQLILTTGEPAGVVYTPLYTE